MGTIVQTFHPVNVDWDGVDPGDYEKLQEALPAATTGGTQAQFGTSGNKDITYRPYVAHANTGVDTAYGWAINLDGAEGMDVPAHADRRRILSGTWNFTGQIRSAPAAALASVKLNIRIYKYNSDGTRTQQGATGTQDMGLLAATDTNFNIDITGVDEIILADGETIVIVEYVNATGQLGGLTVIQSTGNFAVGNDTVVTIPAPGVRSKYFRTQAQVMAGRASMKKLIRPRTNTFPVARMAGVATVTRRLSLRRAMDARMDGVASIKKLIRPGANKFPMARMAGIATIKKKKVFATDNFGSARMVGIATMKKTIRKTFSARLAGVATMVRRLSLARLFSARMAGVPIFSRIVRNRRALSARMVGRASARIEMDFDNVPSGGGGGPPVEVEVIKVPPRMHR